MTLRLPSSVRVRLGALGLCALTLLGAGALAAEPDTSPPVLVEDAHTPDTVDVSAGAQTVVVTLRVTDDSSGAEVPSVTGRSRTTTQSTGFGRTERVSGDARDGVYRSTLTVAEDAAPGAWDITLFPLSDVAGNQNRTFTPLGRFTVVSGSAGPAPTPSGTAGPSATGSPAASPAPAATSSPAAPASDAPAPRPGIAVTPGVIDAGQQVTVTHRGAPGAVLDVLSKTQPATAYSRIGSVVLDQSGTGTTTHRPMKSTRLSARSAEGATSTQPLVQVRSVATLRVVRAAPGRYDATGRVFPARDQRLVSLYRDGVLFGQGRTDASGTYRITKLVAPGSFSLRVRTGDDTHNLGATSPAVALTVPRTTTREAPQR